MVSFSGSRTVRSRVVVLLVALSSGSAFSQVPAQRFESLGMEALRATESFRPLGDSAVDAAAASLRQSLRPLDSLLARSESGNDWRKYLDWPALESQAASGMAADPAVLRRIEKAMNASETGLDMPDFVRVRKAVTRYAEAADAARGPDPAGRLGKRLDALASALLSASATGSAEMLAPVPPILERLSESGQAGSIVAAVRGAMAQPNIHLEVHENLLAGSVNRPIDQIMPVDDVVLGTRIRGSGRTTGNVRLDFVPSADRAVFDLVLDAQNVSNTHGSQGPVTVHTRGVTEIDASRRIFIAGDGGSVTSSPVQASASADTHVTGIGVNKRFGKRLIRRIASRKVAETKPRAEAIAEAKARERVRRQFSEQTDPAVAQIGEQIRTRLRGPLEARGLYPEMFHMHTTDSSLRVVARKALPVQLAAFSPPPLGLAGNVITARIHESAVNNILEEKLGGRIITQADVGRLAREQNAAMPDSLGSDPDQKPWAVTFAKQRPVTVSADDGRLKLMFRGDKFVSGDRDFPGMDIWATYAIESSPYGTRLIREGDVQIYPPGFKPGGKEKLTMAETSLRRILQKRFDKLFRQAIDIEPLPLQGEMAAVGPLPMNQLVARKDGWLVAGWRTKDRVIHLGATGGVGCPADCQSQPAFVPDSRPMTTVSYAR